MVCRGVRFEKPCTYLASPIRKVCMRENVVGTPAGPSHASSEENSDALEGNSDAPCGSQKPSYNRLRPPKQSFAPAQTIVRAGSNGNVFLQEGVQDVIRCRIQEEVQGGCMVFQTLHPALMSINKGVDSNWGAGYKVFKIFTSYPHHVFGTSRAIIIITKDSRYRHLRLSARGLRW